MMMLLLLFSTSLAVSDENLVSTTSDSGQYRLTDIGDGGQGVARAHSPPQKKKIRKNIFGQMSRTIRAFC